MTQFLPQGSRDGMVTGTAPLVSIIIDNYNYGRFLRTAIDSALGQIHPHLEVIVVDDGSTDDSRDIIAGYGSQITKVYKVNGGQASALNAGFAASRGEIILFLDSDDILEPIAAAQAAMQLGDGNASKLHWPMWIIDAMGNKTGDWRPKYSLPQGDCRQQVLERGPSNVASSPTSGNAWSRRFLDRVMPIPEDVKYYRSCADEYLFTLAPVFGEVRAIAEPLGSYRMHDGSVYSGRPFRQRLELELAGYDDQCCAIQGTLRKQGIAVDLDAWKRNSWFHQLDRALNNINSFVPRASSLVLIDNGTWEKDWHSNQWLVRPFCEHLGVDWGNPSDSQSAAEHFDAICAEGVQYLVLAWPSFWWFEEYPDLAARLQNQATCLIRDEVTAIFELTPRSQPADRQLAMRGGGQHD